MSSSLQPHRLQYSRLLCPPLTPSLLKFMPTESVMLSNISSSGTPFSFCLPSFPASGSFPMSQLFISGSQSIGASALATVLPINIQGWFPLGLTDLISLLTKGFSSLFQHHNSKASILQCSAFLLHYSYIILYIFLYNLAKSLSENPLRY